MKALIIGADGLLGSHLVRQLLEKSIEVRVFNLPASTSPTLDGLDIEVVEGDLLDEGDGLLNAVKGCDYVFHVAAITDMWAPDEITWKVNYDGTKNVLDACMETGVKRLINVGSASSYQFGSIEWPGDENAPFPTIYDGVAYMESKAKARDLVNEYVKDRGLSAITIAPTFMLGDLDWRPSSGELIRQFINRKMSVTSPGGRNFAYAPDVAAAMVAGIEKGEDGECFIAGGANLTYMDFFTRVAKIAKVDPPKWIMPAIGLRTVGALASLYQAISGKKVAINSTIAKLSTVGTYYSSNKGIEALGMPQTPIETGIEKTLKSLKDFGHIEL